MCQHYWIIPSFGSIVEATCKYCGATQKMKNYYDSELRYVSQENRKRVSRINPIDQILEFGRKEHRKR